MAHLLFGPRLTSRKPFRPSPHAVLFANPEEAYLHACIAAAPICYIAPETFGLSTPAAKPVDSEFQCVATDEVLLSSPPKDCDVKAPLIIKPTRSGYHDAN
jgi:hypothetical protein